MFTNKAITRVLTVASTCVFIIVGLVIYVEFHYPNHEQRLWQQILQDYHFHNNSTIGKVNYDIWTCGPYVGYLVDDMRLQRDWPNNPTTRQFSETLQVVYEKTFHIGVKLYGYILPPLTGNYEFMIVQKVNKAAVSGEFWLSNDSDPTNLRELLAITYTVMEGFTTYVTISKPAAVNLQNDTFYYFEFHVKSFNCSGDITVMWKLPLFKQYERIPKSCLKMAVKLNGSNYINSTTTSYLIQYLKSSELPSNKLKSIGYKQPVPYKVNNVKDLKILPECDYKPSYVKVMTIKPNKGVFKIFKIESAIYPPDDFKYMYENKPTPQNRNIPKSTADLVTNLYKETFSKQNKYKGKVLGLHYLEESKNLKLGSRFLLEMDVKLIGQEEIIPTSEYVYLPQNSRRLCHISNFQWKRDVDVHFVVSFKGLGRWVRHLIHNMEKIYHLTNDKLFELVIVDYNSTDIDVLDELKKSSLPRWKLITLEGNFSRAGGLQAGVNYVKDPNSIVMTIDMHLTIPPTFIESVRKHSIQGKMAYAPMFFRLNGGYTENNVNGWWEKWTFGLFGMFKSDWSTIGGFDTKQFTTKWGEEDNNLLDRTLSKGYEVFRCRPPGLFHYYHSYVGMWSTKISNYYC